MDNDIRRDAGSTAASARDKVRTKAAEVAGKAKQKIADQYGDKVSEATNEVQHFATALRRAGDNLRDEGTSSIGAMLLSRAADQLESIGSSLNGKDLDTILSDVDRLARRNPAVFAGGALLLGFAASRFFKSSSPDINRNDDFQAADLPRSDFGAGSSSSGFGTTSPGSGTGSGSMGGL